jgi:hypothetical protein
MVCNSKENGGLGVLNLQTHNESLLLKNLHKFYNQVNIPWGTSSVVLLLF